METRMLNVDNVVPFLLARDRIPVSWIIDGDLMTRSVARRNRNLKVEGPDGTGCFLKQAESPTEGDQRPLSGEAAFHRFCQEEPTVAPVLKTIPRLLDVEGTDNVMVFELVADAITLWECWKSPESRDLAVASCRSLGHALGSVHRLFRAIDRARDPRLACLSHVLPWVLNLGRPGPEMLADLGPANYETLRILQQQGDLGESLGQLAATWRPETLIHADVRLDNVLVRASRDEDVPKSPEVWITDWELARFGDPAWDLAGGLQDFLVRWVSTMPRSEGLTEEERIARALVPLDVLRTGARTFWSGYRLGAELGPMAADELLTRAVRFSAARLVQSAFEVALNATRLPGRSVMLLQIAANLLANPDEGQAHLYGILEA